MFDMNEDGVIKKLNRSSVDCYECWWKGFNELQDMREANGLL